MTQIPDNLYNALFDFGLQNKQIIAIYIFGSTATGKYRNDSDIDIAIMVRGPMEGIERIHLETSLSNLLKRDVDLIIFDNASPLLKHQILKYGHLVFESDPKERVRQEVSARRDYLDSLGLYRVIEG